MTVLFRPKAHMMEQCARFLVDAEKSIFEIPMKVGVAQYSPLEDQSGHVEVLIMMSVIPLG